MVYLFTVILAVVTITACSDKENELHNSLVTGQWQLMGADMLISSNGNWQEVYTDYTDENIFYRFDNSTLIITGENSPGHAEGTYPYSIEREMNGDSELIWVIIENSRWTYLFEDGQMILSIAYVDGPTLYFEIVN